MLIYVSELCPCAVSEYGYLWSFSSVSRRRYMAEKSPIRRKTLPNQSIQCFAVSAG